MYKRRRTYGGSDEYKVFISGVYFSQGIDTRDEGYMLARHYGDNSPFYYRVYLDDLLSGKNNELECTILLNSYGAVGPNGDCIDLCFNDGSKDSFGGNTSYYRSGSILSSLADKLGDAYYYRLMLSNDSDHYSTRYLNVYINNRLVGDNYDHAVNIFIKPNGIFNQIDHTSFEYLPLRLVDSRDYSPIAAINVKVNFYNSYYPFIPPL